MPRGRDKLTIAVTVVCCDAAVGRGASGSAGNTGTSASPTLAIKFADCMRTHGVPNYPDPVFPSSGGVEIAVGTIDPQSPAFKAAVKLCGLPFAKGGHRPQSH
jgi:hypothetical protein